MTMFTFEDTLETESETHPGFPLLRSSEDFVVVRFYIVQAYTFSSTKIIFSGCIRN